MKPQSPSASLKMRYFQHIQQLAKVSNCLKEFQDAFDGMRFTSPTHALQSKDKQLQYNTVKVLRPYRGDKWC